MIIWNHIESPKLNKPVLVEGLPGIGNVGKVASEYLIEKTKARKFAELYSDNFPYHVFVNEDDSVDLPRNEFYYLKRKSGDVVMITGDIQSMTPQGHYEIANAMLDFAKKLGVKDVYTLGGFGVPELPKKAAVIGAVSEQSVQKRYQKFGVKFEGGERVGIIIGASGLLLGMGKLKGMKGLCLMGETLNRPMFTDAKASQQVLSVLCKILNIKIDMRDMEARGAEMDRAIVKAQEIERRMMDERGAAKDDFRYIG